MKYVYRIVNAVLGALVFVASLFTGFIKLRIETGETLDDIFNKLSSDKASGVAVAEEFSIMRVIRMFTGKDDLSFLVEEKTFAGIYWPEEFNVMNVRLALFAGSFVLMLVAGLFLIIWSCFTDKRIPVIVVGVLGIVLDIVMILSFRSLSTDIYTGKVDLMTYLIDRIFGEGILSLLLGTAADKALTLILTLCGLQNALLFIFMGVVIWTAAFYVVDIGDPQVKAEKAALKEAKAAKKQAKAAKKNAEKEVKA